MLFNYIYLNTYNPEINVCSVSTRQPEKPCVGLRGSSPKKKLFCLSTDLPEILVLYVKLQGEDILFVYFFFD